MSAEDLGPDAPPELVRLAERLQAERPIPATAFRGQLRRRLAARGPRRARPARLRALIAGYAASGALLLAIAAVSVAGAGPLAG